jgi:RNA polymerase sigma-B factor
VATVSSTEQQPAAQRERLIESHLPLVKAVARRYAGRDAELDDLVQVGAIGLIKASDRFDPGKGVAFATFATPTIEGEIRHHLRDRGAALRIPRQLQDLSRKIHRCEAELGVTLGRSPTPDEVADALQISADEVEQALVAERARDALPLPAEDEVAGAEEPSLGSDNRVMLASSMRALDERERQIVYLRFHADKTERQIARVLGISQAHVSRLLKGALTKLQISLENVGDITPPSAISPINSPQNQTKRASRKGGRRRPKPLTDTDLQAAIEGWLSAEGYGETANLARPPSPETAGAERKGHSGRFLVRMPSTLHEQLAQAAERDQVSLNRFVTQALATTISPTPAAEAATADTPAAGPPPVRTIRMVLAANLVIVVVCLAVAAVLLVLALQRGI